MTVNILYQRGNDVRQQQFEYVTIYPEWVKADNDWYSRSSIISVTHENGPTITVSESVTE